MLYPVCVSICANASFNEIFLFCMVIFLSLFCAIVVRDRKVKNKIYEKQSKKNLTAISADDEQAKREKGE